MVAYVSVDVDLQDIDDDELIDELKTRGYNITHPYDNYDKPKDEDSVISEMIWRYKNGYIEDAMLLLERRFPKMYGISKRIK